jgi:hypothetical protein
MFSYSPLFVQWAVKLLVELFVQLNVQLAVNLFELFVQW